MKNIGNDNIAMEEGDPAFRSCWVCNPSHDYLKSGQGDMLFFCLWCGRYWCKGVDFSAEECRPEGALTDALIKAGIPLYTGSLEGMTVPT